MRLFACLALVVLVGGVGLAGSSSRRADRFDEDAAWAFLVRQVELGPRPAGSPASRRLGAMLRRSIPRGNFQRVPGGLRNVVGTVPGREPGRFVVVGAHYDTKDLPDFVGANDGASGVAVVRQLARTIRPRTMRPTLVFVFFDGEETPRGVPDSQVLRKGLRGSKVAARAFRRAEAMILFDLVGDRELAIRRDVRSDPRLWSSLRRSAVNVGAGRVFLTRPPREILDDHVPFAQAGVRTLPLIDLGFRCWHKPCDDLSAVSRESLDAVGESVFDLLKQL